MGDIKLKAGAILLAVFALGFTANVIANSGQEGEGDVNSSLTAKVLSMNYSDKSEQTNIITTIGSIVNASDTGAQEITVEVKYFDANHNLIDTITQALYDIVILPHREVSFRVRGVADKPRESYASATVGITAASPIEPPERASNDEGSPLFHALISWAPMLLLIGMWIYFINRMKGKNSPQSQSIRLIQEQNELLTRELEILGRLAAAVEKASSRKTDTLREAAADAD
jgi:ATP-dependent Zn protease